MSTARTFVRVTDYIVTSGGGKITSTTAAITVGSGQSFSSEIRIVAKITSTGETYAWYYGFNGNNASGTFTLSTGYTFGAPGGDAALSGASVGFLVSGGKPSATVTGIASTNIEWLIDMSAWIH